MLMFYVIFSSNVYIFSIDFFFFFDKLTHIVLNKNIYCYMMLYDVDINQVSKMALQSYMILTGFN